MNKMFIAIVATLSLYAFAPNMAEASLVNNLGLNKHQAKQAAKAARKALGKHNHKNGNPPPVSPASTFIAQLLQSQEDSFLMVYNSLLNGEIGKRQAKRFLRRTIKLDFRIAGHRNRKEFKDANGVGRRGVYHDYLAAFANGGILPIYF